MTTDEQSTTASAHLTPARPVRPTSIAGRFRIAGASPDGDSVRFVPDDPRAWARAGIRARANAAGGAQLRLDAIDTLETHFSPPGGRGTWRQPVDLAVGATESLLHRLGFTSWKRDADTGTITDPQPLDVPGWVVCAGADVNGRPVSFVLAGDRAAAGAEWSHGGSDGGGGRIGDGPVTLTPSMLGRTLNSAQLADGLAYPTFYDELPDDLREALATTATAARAAGLGVWARDVTTAGFVVTGRAQLETEVVVLPKLFRRLAEYLSLDTGGDGTGSSSLARFGDFLAVSADAVRVVPDTRAGDGGAGDGVLTTLADLVEVDGQRVRLLQPVEWLVFVEKETRLRVRPGG